RVPAQKLPVLNVPSSGFRVVVVPNHWKYPTLPETLGSTPEVELPVAGWMPLGLLPALENCWGSHSLDRNRLLSLAEEVFYLK
ncbi:hypothetical protein CEXT_131781, partial [Caerostris extrusa]